ncbi:LuxR C-terminal-related transcriptional regulator [Candidatus Woesearchaeota archaeon]|nr:LuxR C-terminal-related transcriptional regulator [Candidatus Woesearchaeota archaeon]
MINKEKRTQKQVSDISGISEVTLRAKVKELTEKLKIKNKSVLKK